MSQFVETARWERNTQKRLEGAGKLEIEADPDDALAQLISFADQS